MYLGRYFFKFWLCENLHRLKLYYSQHGVSYGMTLFILRLKKFSRFYLGWNEKNKNIVPFYSTKVKINQRSFNNFEKILIINKSVSNIYRKIIQQSSMAMRVKSTMKK